MPKLCYNYYESLKYIHIKYICLEDWHDDRHSFVQPTFFSSFFIQKLGPYDNQTIIYLFTFIFNSISWTAIFNDMTTRGHNGTSEKQLSFIRWSGRSTRP